MLETHRISKRLHTGSRMCAYAVGYGPHYRTQGILLRNSFKKFHPEIPLYIFDQDDERYLFGTVNNEEYIGIKRLRFGCRLLEDFEGILLLGTDVVVCATLDDLVCPPVRTDFVATLDIRRTSPLSVTGYRYANADVIAIFSKLAMSKWYQNARDLTASFRLPPHSVNDWEQGVLNFLILPDNTFSVRFPELDSPVYYNLRSRWFWQDAYLKDGFLYASNGRLIRSIHWNGSGGTLPGNKLRSSTWSKDVTEFFSAITSIDVRQFTPTELPFTANDAMRDLGGNM